MHIFFQFDVRTVALFVAMAFFVQSTAIGAQAYLIRELRQYRGVGAAMLANLVVAVGLLLRLFSDQLPEFLTAILSNILLLIGPALFYVALSRFTGLSYNKTLVSAVIVTVLALLLYYTYRQDDIQLRMMTLSVGSITIVLILIYQLWRTQKTTLRFSANLMLLSFAAHALFLMVRTVSLLLNPPQSTFNLNPVQSATYLLSFAISFFWSTGFVLMVSHRLRNDLMAVATIDVLTHIPNRRATQAFLEKELSRARRNNSEFSVLLIDLDNFKQVNDRWGHAVGDQVLMKIAGTFQSLLRKGDWVGRWGGEEFLVILPGSPSCVAETLAERLRSEIANSKFKHSKGTLGITVSIGVACATQADEIDQILKIADMALYKAKQTKNTVHVASNQAA